MEKYMRRWERLAVSIVGGALRQGSSSVGVGNDAEPGLDCQLLDPVHLQAV